MNSIQLAEQPEFISWIQSRENDEEWEQFVMNNPEMQKEIKEAREIVKHIKFYKSKGLIDLEKSVMLDNIQNFEKNVNNVKSKKFFLTHKFKIAAIWLLLISVGGILSYNLFFKLGENYNFSTSTSVSHSNFSQLHLANGNTIQLESENSSIVVEEGNKIIVDEEKKIDVSNNDKIKEDQLNELVIPYGRKSFLSLSDGTKVWLNAGSKFAFPEKFEGKNRMVFLEGEAYFEVAHNKDKPFIVKTKDINIKVLGTKFNVSAYSMEENTLTTLLEGKVAVKENSSNIFNKEYTMKPNEVARFDKKSNEITVCPEKDVLKSISWVNGFIEFKKENIKGLLDKLHRYYNVEFEFDKNFNSKHNISGKLDLKDSIESVLQILGQMSNIKFNKKGEKIYVESN